MSTADRNAKTDPAACGCCEDAAPGVPRRRDNPAGQTRIDQRIGTHGAFKAAMLGRVGRTGALRRLTVRDDDDPTIALLDGWASVLDVVGFYQQEIANEGFLRTAEERFSVLQLAAGIGYRLQPGLGSETCLAFDCEVTPATPLETVIPAGTQVQSTPAPGETPQIFETKADITGRPEWNALRPRLTEPAPIRRSVDTIYLAGTATRLEPGQPLLFLAADAASDPANATFDLRWVRGIETFEKPTPADPRPPHTKIRLDRRIRRLRTSDDAVVLALRQRASAFGHNAMRWRDLPLPLRVGEVHPETLEFLTGPYAGASDAWAGTAYPASKTQLFLDQVYRRIVADSWVALFSPSATALYRVTGVHERTHAEFLVTAKATRLSIAGSGIEGFSPRSTTALCESEALDVAERPRTTPVSGAHVVLNARIDGLTKGRLVALTGASSADGAPVGEVLRIKAVELASSGLTRLRFETAMEHSYDRLSLRINANVVEANVGVARGEVLGDGDASVPFQGFKLQSTPLTYVSSSGGTGAETTLKVRVDGQLWREVDSFFGHGPQERVYTVTHGDGGEARITFGDGRLAGARPASGNSNVTASLRVGIGTDGNLPAGRVDQLLSRPLGVRGVGNPVPAAGAADAELMADARRNAAIQTRMVDRIVSLRDYQDFASGFAGIEKALAQTLWSRKQRLVHVTVAGAGGAPVLPGTTLYDNLRDGIDRARHSDEPVQIGSHQTRHFTLAADLTVAPDLVAGDVLAAARSALEAAFAFAARGFGQAVTKSEIAAVLHDVTGVSGVILRALHFTGVPPEVAELLPAHVARMTSTGVAKAELLVIDPATLDLKGAM